MMIYVCKRCGGVLNVSEDDTFAVCPYCGVKQNVSNPDGERKTQQANGSEQLGGTGGYNNTAAGDFTQRFSEEAKKEYELKRKLRKRKRKKKAIVFLLTVVALAAAVLGFFAQRAQKNYNEAEALMAEQRYAEAADKYSEASGYADANEKRLECMSRCAQTVNCSGTGSDVISGIMLPQGTFRITATMTSGYANLVMYFNYGGRVNEYGFEDIDEMIFNEYTAGTSMQTTISGPVKNGSITVNAHESYNGEPVGWKIIVEAIN